MARARNIKPGFFRNAELVELPFEARLLFIGLWTIADREGRLEDRPKQIKMEVFPADNVDCNQLIAGRGVRDGHKGQSLRIGRNRGHRIRQTGRDGISDSLDSSCHG